MPLGLTDRVSRQEERQIYLSVYKNREAFVEKVASHLALIDGWVEPRTPKLQDEMENYIPVEIHCI